MTKKEFKKKIQIVEKDDLVYSVIYVVRGCHDGESPVTIRLHFSLEDAMDDKEVFESLGIYDSVYIIEELVW